MSTKNIIAAGMITLGAIVLAYSGISFSTPGKPINFLGLHVATTDSHYISPTLGALLLVGGAILLCVNTKRA